MSWLCEPYCRHQHEVLVISSPMTDTDPDPIFLYRVDLGVSQDRSFTANLGSSSAITSSFKPARFLSEVPFLQHWTLQVRGICYEVTEKDPDPNRLRDDKPGHGLYILPMREWHRRRRAKGLRCRKDILGATNWSDEKIRSLAINIWSQRFELQWSLRRQNCQNFAAILHDLITLRGSEKKRVPKAQRKLWTNRPMTLTELKTMGKSLLPTAAGASSVISVVEYSGLPFVLEAGALLCAGCLVVMTFDIANRDRDLVWKKQLRKAKEPQAVRAEDEVLQDQKRKTYYTHEPPHREARRHRSDDQRTGFGYAYI